MKRRNVVALVIVALALAALVAWLASHVERYSRTEDVGASAEARRDPYLAYKRLLGDLGLPSTEHYSLAEAPPDGWSAFVWLSGSPMSERASEVLLAWIERGGNLVVLLPSRAEQRELIVRAVAKGRYDLPLARGLDVELATDYVDPDEDEDEDQPAAKPRPSTATATVRLDAEALQVDLPQDLWFQHFDAEEGGDVEYVARRRRGAGQATFVASDLWLTNAYIGKRDHARLAWQLANLGGRPQGVWLMTAERQIGLFAWIAREGWMVLASGAAFLALWVWKRGARFGPVLADPPREHRDFSEHIRATAAFLWRRREAAVLLAAPRAELAQRVALMRPDLSSASPAVVARELARVSGLDAAAVGEALETQHPTEPAAFQRIVANLSRLRSSL